MQIDLLVLKIAVYYYYIVLGLRTWRSEPFKYIYEQLLSLVVRSYGQLPPLALRNYEDLLPLLPQQPFDESVRASKLRRRSIPIRNVPVTVIRLQYDSVARGGERHVGVGSQAAFVRDSNGEEYFG